MRGGNSCSAETFTTRRVGLRRSGVPAAILPNHSATGSRLGVAPDNSTAPVRRSGIGNCWASCESAVGRGQPQSGQDRLRRPVAARLRRSHRRYLIERTFHIAHYAKSTTSHGISDAHFSLAEHDDDRIALQAIAQATQPLRQVACSNLHLLELKCAPAFRQRLRIIRQSHGQDGRPAPQRDPPPQ